MSAQQYPFVPPYSDGGGPMLYSKTLRTVAGKMESQATILAFAASAAKEAALRYRDAANMLDGKAETNEETASTPSVSPSQGEVLAALNGKAMTNKQIAKTSKMKSGTVSSALHYLMRKGLVQRVGRGVYVRPNTDNE